MPPFLATAPHGHLRPLRQPSTRYATGTTSLTVVLRSSPPGRPERAKRRPPGTLRTRGTGMSFPPGCPVTFHWPGRPGFSFVVPWFPPLRVFRVILLPVQARLAR